MNTTAINRTWIELMQGVFSQGRTTINSTARLASGLKRCRGDGGLHCLTCGHCEVIRT